MEGGRGEEGLTKPDYGQRLWGGECRNGDGPGK